MAKRMYKAADGTEYPVVESQWDIEFMVYKSDRKKAKIGDPTGCILALGIRHNKDVKEAYIGAGKDAYVIFKATAEEPARAVHFTIPAASGKVRDLFDTKGAPKTAKITLRRPTAGRTLHARSVLNKERNTAINNGTAVRKVRGPNKNSRVTRLNVPNRPRAQIKKGVVEITQQA